jgi:ADP-heptose:LPS heptosyltransferase
MLNTYVIEGGIGKCTAFTALIPKLAKKAGESIQIYTPYIDVFAFNPDVSMAYEQSLPMTDPRIAASDNILYCEPYKSNFVLGKQHLIESYCNLFGIDYEPSMTPKLYTTHLRERAAEWLEKNGVTGKYMIVQFSGGQTPIGWNPNQPYASHDPSRNYPTYLAQQVVSQLLAEYPNVTIINATLPNEPSFVGTVKYSEHWAVLHELLKQAEGFICIDSCINHFSASVQKGGVVIWGSTRWTQFGYGHNTNLQFHMKDKWDEARFNPEDPRNVLIDPKVVVEAYKKRLATGKTLPTNVVCLSA